MVKTDISIISVHIFGELFRNMVGIILNILRKQRRNIKDEKLVLSGIKSQGITYLNRQSVQKCVDGLSKRKYRIRIVEEEEDT